MQATPELQLGLWHKLFFSDLKKIIICFWVKLLIKLSQNAATEKPSVCKSFETLHRYFSALFLLPAGWLELVYIFFLWQEEGLKFLQLQAQFPQVKAGPPEPGVQEVWAPCLHNTCSVSESALGSCGQHVPEFTGVEKKKVVGKNVQLNSQKWSRCDKSIFIMLLIWKPVVLSCQGPPAFSWISVCSQILIPSKAMGLLCITQNCSRKSFTFHYPLAIFVSVRFLNVMTKFLGTKTRNKFPGLCLMQGLLQK